VTGWAGGTDIPKFAVRAETFVISRKAIIGYFRPTTRWCRSGRPRWCLRKSRRCAGPIVVGVICRNRPGRHARAGFGQFGQLSALYAENSGALSVGSLAVAVIASGAPSIPLMANAVDV